MNYHIVRTNEKIETILNIYNLNISELKDINTHISNWNNLIPGTRLKLPEISESIMEELNDVEPFIEDYYPKIDIKKYESVDNQDIPLSNETEIVENIETKITDNYQTESTNENKVEMHEKNVDDKTNIIYNNSIKLPPSYNYYYNPYDYYRYLKRRIKK